MYEIISGGKLLEICEKPIYTKLKKESGAFIEVPYEEATGVAVNGTNYAIFGTDKVPYEGAPVAEIREVSGARYLFEAHTKAVKSEGDVTIIESAVMDLDVHTQESIDDITAALFELDARISSSN